ncbi:MAG: hypothetical protein GX929_07765 [Clostridiales bacterium]|nr:hypothetical protein [Clostridiales bacterium]
MTTLRCTLCRERRPETPPPVATRTGYIPSRSFAERFALRFTALHDENRIIA